MEIYRYLSWVYGKSRGFNLPQNSQQQKPQQQPYVYEGETLENFDVKVKSSDVLIVPEGKKSSVPERLHDRVIELPNSYGYSIIR